MLDGDYAAKADKAYEMQNRLVDMVKQESVDSFCEVVVAKNVPLGFRNLVQSAGLGNMRPNMVVMRWPELWRDSDRGKNDIPRGFVSIANDTYTAGKALTVIKGIDNFPTKLHRILSCGRYRSIIAWKEHGRSWTILDKERLSTVVCPENFSHSNFDSFNRSVNG